MHISSQLVELDSSLFKLQMFECYNHNCNIIFAEDIKCTHASWSPLEVTQPRLRARQLQLGRELFHLSSSKNIGVLNKIGSQHTLSSCQGHRSWIDLIAASEGLHARGWRVVPHRQGLSGHFQVE